MASGDRKRKDSEAKAEAGAAREAGRLCRPEFSTYKTLKAPDPRDRSLVVEVTDGARKPKEGE